MKIAFSNGVKKLFEVEKGLIKKKSENLQDQDVDFLKLIAE